MRPPASLRVGIGASSVMIICAFAPNPADGQTFVRVGHFNIRELDHTELDTTTNAQTRAAAEIIQRHAPDILSINEMSYDLNGVAGSTHTGVNVQLFEDNYLGVSQNEQPAITYPHKYFVKGNSGLDSGLGFDYGFGNFEGQFNMAFYSKFPILTGQVRRFQTFLWTSLPGNIKPASVPDQQRLFDKDFWDIPIDVNGHMIHVLMCHAVVPVFDATNDERNFDTLRFIADYIAGQAVYAVPDGGIQPGDRFVLIGDLNADPEDGDSLPGAVQQITSLSRVNPNFPEGDGLDTNGVPPDSTSYNTGSSNFTRNTFKSGIGNTSAGGFQLQLDYILPSWTLPLAIAEAGQTNRHVFWDQIGTADWTLQRTASDHHFVWTDLAVCPDPFADVDQDGNTDQRDFAHWQACFSGDQPGRRACSCFDRDSHGRIDGDDYDAFEACASGAGVPVDPACDD